MGAQLPVAAFGPELEEAGDPVSSGLAGCALSLRGRIQAEHVVEFVCLYFN